MTCARVATGQTRPALLPVASATHGRPSMFVELSDKSQVNEYSERLLAREVTEN